MLGVAAVVCVSSAVAGELLQDFKAGYILGGTPRNIQVAELIAVVVASLSLLAVRGSLEPYAAAVHLARPHPGQQQVARHRPLPGDHPRQANDGADRPSLGTGGVFMRPYAQSRETTPPRLVVLSAAKDLGGGPPSQRVGPGTRTARLASDLHLGVGKGRLHGTS